MQLKQKLYLQLLHHYLGDTKLASPKVRKFARELGANVSDISGSQRAGRVSEEDVKSFVRSQVTVNREK